MRLRDRAGIALPDGRKLAAIGRAGRSSEISHHLCGDDDAGDHVAERAGGDHQQARQLLIGQVAAAE